MKTAPMTALSIAALMFLSIFASIGALITEQQNTQIELEDNPIEMDATSPGYPVFAEYMGAHWCGPCKTSSAGLHSLSQSNGDDFTYLSFWESSTTGWPSDGPINRRSHIQNAPGYTGGIPVTVFGDAPSGTYYTVGGQTYDSYYQNGGNTKNGNDYTLSVIQSENVNVMDIEITAAYSGSGSKTVYLYSAVAEETSPEVYDGGSQNPHHVWKKWLLNGAGNGFESLTLTAGQSVTTTWSVPINVVRAGGGHTAADNFLTVAALFSGDHTNHRDVVSASDSNMAPLIDLGLFDLSLDNPAAVNGGYINGDIIDLDASVKNFGVDAYDDGGDIQFYYKDGISKVYIDSPQSLGNFASTGVSKSFSVSFDTTTLADSNYQTTFGVELTGLTQDARGSNNDDNLAIAHDLIPISRKAQVIDSNEIERGNNFLVEAKVSINDNVDLNTSFFTFELETTLHNTNDWSSSIVTGGEELFNIDTDNEHREYLFSPTMEMGAGNYDIRARAIDSRDQVSDWHVTENAFILMNALPVINSYPVPTVKVQTSTMVHISDNIEDAETALEDLVITSTSPNFIAWHPDTQDIEVYFENIRFVSGTATASGVEINVDDGSAIAHGTLLFNVIENGQPRWAGVEKQYVDEASSGAINFLSYLSDTNDDGTVASPEDLVLAIIDNSNPELLEFDLREFTLNFETTDDDINGETTITVRASDGMSYSDQLVTIAINPINDAPRLDLSEYEDVRLKVGVQKIIYLNEIMSDVDGDLNEVIITANNPNPGAARINFLDNTLTMIWHDEGLQTVTIQVEDRYDSNIYTIVVDVYDSVPLLVGEGPDGDVKLSVTGVYVEEIPQITMFLNKDDVTITSLTSTWQLCNEMTGVCTLNVVHEHDITQKSLGWTFDPFKGQLGDEGMRQKDQIKLVKVMAIDSAGDKYEYKNTLYWTANEEAPGPETMDADEVAALISELEAQIAIKESELALMTEGSSEHAEASATLEEIKSDYTEACTYGTCISDDSQAATTDDSESLNMNVLVGVIGVIILVLIIGLLFLRGGKNNDGPDIVDWANALPANDTVANSMYGGAQELFTQPVAVPAPAAVAQVQPGVLPLPPGGLPAGWSMEQWAHYGHQYQQ
jgi:thiol-disulfide isomerase/thioredoxin